MEAWKIKMERVASETQKAYAEHKRDGTWFFPEYYAFKERREFFFLFLRCLYRCNFDRDLQVKLLV